MKNVFISKHPLIQHKLTMLRDKTTGSKQFRELTSEITLLLGYEATASLKLREVEVTTPIGTAQSKMMKDSKIALVPVLRAGLQMADGLMNVLPAAKIGHIGLYRDRDRGQTVEYYCKMPEDICERDVIVLDPLIATGNSISKAVERVIEHNPRSVRIITLVASREGIEKFHKLHPEIEVYIASIDDSLDADGMINPGVGDVADRIFGTM